MNKPTTDQQNQMVRVQLSNKQSITGPLQEKNQRTPASTRSRQTDVWPFEHNSRPVRTGSGITKPETRTSPGTRGHPPVVAIGEAKRKAASQGFVVIIIATETPLPVDFAIDDRGCISLVRIRRLKYAQYDIATIQRLCTQDIAELRKLKVPDGIFREIWARGPNRRWYRYLVLPESIVMINESEVEEWGS